MTPDEFRQHGHAVVEWVARYLESVEQYPVLSQVEPGTIRQRLPVSPPRSGEPFERVLEDFDDKLMPGVTHWQSPGFFAYFPANASGPAILAELVSAGLGVQGMLWSTSPACTELETHMLDWVAQMLGLAQRFRSSGRGGGVIQDSASSATLCALLAARERATSGGGNERGLDRPLTAYTSNQAHSSVEKAAMIAGVGRSRLRLVDVDAGHRLDVGALERRVVEDRERGLQPFFVSATVGTTSSAAIDPIGPIAALCERERLWLHVDAAYAGTAALCPELRWIHDGLEGADSYCFNPHKWMLTNFDCNCFYVADRESLTNALSILPEYLRNRATESGAVIDYRDWQIPLGRRFRALKLWFVIRHYGVDGLRAHVRKHLALARSFAAAVQHHRDFELAAPAHLGLVCFRHRSGDAVNQAIMDRINRAGRYFITHTRLDARLTLRMASGGTATEQRHVDGLWQAVIEAASAFST
ncbi:MAG: pyridoxal-dependent decarboxylase [Gammaproteobacteria bacterium]